VSPAFDALFAVATAVLILAALAGWVLFGYGRFLRYHRFKRLELEPLPPRRLVAYVLGELGAMLQLTWWHLYARGRDGLRVPPGPPSGPPVLCVHGITQNGTNLWGIRRALEARGRATRAVSLGRFGLSLEQHAERLVAALRELVAASPDGRVDVIAHSMGGVVLRVAMAAHPELAAHLHHVVTLATPHFGTAGARGLPLGSTVRRLGRRSTLLIDLPGLPKDITVTTIAARHDVIVYPIVTCHLPGGRAVVLPDVGHTGLLTRPLAIRAVVEAICEPDARVAQRRGARVPADA
jgi:pimeloyl-ACP methyl ester carboxylesterase